MEKLCTIISENCTSKTNIYLLTFSRCWHFQHTNPETNSSFGFVQTGSVETNNCANWIYYNYCEDFDGPFTVVDYKCTDPTDTPKYRHLDYIVRK